MRAKRKIRRERERGRGETRRRFSDFLKCLEEIEALSSHEATIKSTQLVALPKICGLEDENTEDWMGEK